MLTLAPRESASVALRRVGGCGRVNLGVLIIRSSFAANRLLLIGRYESVAVDLSAQTL